MENIVITGFMGTGKTTAGRMVAQRLGREFVDMDELIVAREGKSIAQIFKDEGALHFRMKESELCDELGQREGLVIATGGGALIDDHNRAVLSRQARVFCLQAAPATIAQRLEGDARRPLLDERNETQTVIERITELLRRREAAYALIPYHIQTDGLSAEQVAENIVACAQQDVAIDLRRTVQAGSETYEVVLGAGVWKQLGVLLRERLPKSERAAIVSDDIVGPLHGETIKQSLEATGFTTTLITMPSSESAKNLETVSMLYDRFIDAQLERSSVVLALGGGLVGDVAGFAAATYLRGVNFVQLPTTALSVVDASLGGKTAVNHAKGKNLIGAFKQPVLVCADREALTALPVADFRSGLAEIVKHGIIGAPDLFAHLETRGLQDLPRILADAIEVKLKVIEADPHERAERAVLNLGHTFGHAFENLSEYRLRHGEAVAMGLVAATKLAARLELCEPELVYRVEALLRQLQLPTMYDEFDAEQALAVMATDKKKAQGKIRFVLPEALGKVVVRGDVAREDVAAVLEEGKEDEEGEEGNTGN
jgi:3-dehydroquinate synthase